VSRGASGARAGGRARAGARSAGAENIPLDQRRARVGTLTAVSAAFRPLEHRVGSSGTVMKEGAAFGGWW